MEKNITDYLRLEDKTIGTFEKVAYLLKDSVITEQKAIDAIINVLEELKVDDDIIDDLDMEDIANIVTYFKNGQMKFDLENIPNTIEVNNRVYVAPDYTTFKLKGRYLGLAFEHMQDSDFPSYALALIFKDESLTSTEHLSPAHIKHKQSLFKNVLMKDYYPYIIKIQQDAINANTNIVKASIKEEEKNA